MVSDQQIVYWRLRGYITHSYQTKRVKQLQLENDDIEALICWSLDNPKQIDIDVFTEIASFTATYDELMEMFP